MWGGYGAWRRGPPHTCILHLRVRLYIIIQCGEGAGQVDKGNLLKEIIRLLREAGPELLEMIYYLLIG